MLIVWSYYMEPSQCEYKYINENLTGIKVFKSKKKMQKIKKAQNVSKN